jgi:hypothetical protein
VWPDWLTFRPIEKWPGDLTPEWLRKRSPFSAPFGSTLQVLGRELDNLNAQRPVLQVALRDRDIRLDGKPRADARASHPGVILGYSRRGKSKRFSSPAHARSFLAEVAGLVTSAPDELLYRKAAQFAHPDKETGSHEKFLKVKEAHRLLTADDTFQFAVDMFPSWQDNLRAIALGLEALRKVERYGIANRGEQYAGWAQLTAGGPS